MMPSTIATTRATAPITIRVIFHPDRKQPAEEHTTDVKWLYSENDINISNQCRLEVHFL